LHHRSVTLASHIKNLTQLNVAPDLGPARMPVAPQGKPTGICTGLVFALGEKQFGDPVIGKGTKGIIIQQLLVLSQRFGLVILSRTG
jgi:hypothetical protein